MYPIRRQPVTLGLLSLDIAHQLIVELDKVIFVFAGAKLDAETEQPLAVRDGDRLLVGDIE